MPIPSDATLPVIAIITQSNNPIISYSETEWYYENVSALYRRILFKNSL